MADGIDFKMVAPQVMASMDLLIETFAARVNKVRKPENRAAIKAGHAIAVIAMADSFLASMPVEMAMQYRQLAKEFNAGMEKAMEGEKP